MKKIISLNIILAFLICSVSYAQTPGYLGKKNTIQVGFNSSPTFNGLTGRCNEIEIDDRLDAPGRVRPSCSLLGLSYGVTGRITRSVSRAISLTADAHIYNTDMIAEYTALTKEFISQEYFSTRTMYSLENIKAKEFFIGAQFFSLQHGAIAPMGAYFGLAFGFGSYNSTFKDSLTDNEFFDTSEPVVEMKIPVERDARSYPLIKLEIGNSIVLKDKFLLNINLSGSYPISAETIGENQYDNPFDYNNEEAYYSYQNTIAYGRSLGTRILNRNIFTLGLNVGIIY